MARANRLRIPESSYEALQVLLTLSPEQVRALDEAIAETRPTLWTIDFANAAAAAVGGSIAPSSVSQIIYLLSGLYVARATGALDIEEFVEQVCAAMEDSGEALLLPPNSDWSGFKERLARLLDHEQSFGVTAKRTRGSLILRRPPQASRAWIGCPLPSLVT
jgi:hypothetical protein